MPSKQQHLDQASKNERLYHQFDLDKTEFLDWAVTVLFYSLLHYLDAFLAQRQPSRHPRSHAERDDEVGRSGQLTQVWQFYRRLKDESRNARYEVPSFTPASVRQLEQSNFQPAKTHVQLLL